MYNSMVEMSSLPAVTRHFILPRHVQAMLKAPC